ncbi:DUF1285 domain-containing protein [Novosphingobium beihaiensis]|uniref:DUF1285 domain-containing protein n=1 Tax=Novosphingobium beihaiensis TaxID=2930389 RepID=A0ABT0BM15_9SPHN|nr:DUF1285 domain-containing protein [Novosphingobium beihaiensis]MCJ2186094.1 DUF1285 domain-containing protein [Novosphingobium beihaiensis]
MPYEPPPELAALSLAEAAQLVAARKLPPVSQWAPEAEGDSEMRITADGRWFHQGSEIRRPAMVRAFASLLVRDEDGQHWLVTPTQKLSIAVDDAAFIAIDVKQDGDALVFKLNSDDLVIAGPDHPIRAEGDPDTPAIYVSVRHGTEARLNRSTYAQLAEIALESGDLSVSSQGMRFALQPA